MLKVIAQDFIKPEFLNEVKPLYKELVEKTRQEKNCISYDLFVDQKKIGHFIFIEEWTNKEALNAHCQSEHFKRLVPLINQFQSKECIILLMDHFD